VCRGTRGGRPLFIVGGEGRQPSLGRARARICRRGPRIGVHGTTGPATASGYNKEGSPGAMASGSLVPRRPPRHPGRRLYCRLAGRRVSCLHERTSVGIRATTTTTCVACLPAFCGRLLRSDGACDAGASRQAAAAAAGDADAEGDPPASQPRPRARLCMGKRRLERGTRARGREYSESGRWPGRAGHPAGDTASPGIAGRGRVCAVPPRPPTRGRSRDHDSHPRRGRGRTPVGARADTRSTRHPVAVSADTHVRSLSRCWPHPAASHAATTTTTTTPALHFLPLPACTMLRCRSLLRMHGAGPALLVS
jgi:hypothetical protein